MGEMVQCVKLQKEAEGLDRAPYPGELGQRILENVSKEAWQMWFQQQTMLINEYRLNPVDPKARTFLEQQMEQFFFGDGATAPVDFTPQQ
jgi:Fe-S cluster biosynthesis and repair protein YggX